MRCRRLRFEFFVWKRNATFCQDTLGTKRTAIKLLKGVVSRRWDSGERVCERRLSAGGSAGDKVRRPRDWLVRQNRLFSRCQFMLKTHHPHFAKTGLGHTSGNKWHSKTRRRVSAGRRRGAPLAREAPLDRRDLRVALLPHALPLRAALPPRGPARRIRCVEAGHGADGVHRKKTLYFGPTTFDTKTMIILSTKTGSGHPQGKHSQKGKTSSCRTSSSPSTPSWRPRCSPTRTSISASR